MCATKSVCNVYHFLKVNRIYFICILIGSLVNRVQCGEIKIEAETMAGNVSDISKRSTASGHLAVHLFQDQRLYADVCLLSPTRITDMQVFYSNDGLSDRVEVSIGNVRNVITTRTFTNQGHGWDTFRASTEQIGPTTLIGRQFIQLTVLQSDSHGVEIDFIKFYVNTSLTLESLECDAFCFDDISYTYDGLKTMSQGRAEQMSVKTLCAEEDNVNVPIFHPNPQKFVITASMPKYRSFLNNRGADWDHCKFYTAFWTFSNIQLSGSRTVVNDSAQLEVKSTSGELLVTRRIAVLEVDFILGNVSSGSTESVIGTVTALKGLKFVGSLAIQFQYFDRYNEWSPVQTKTVKTGDTLIEFETPDNVFREGSGNQIRIEVVSDQDGGTDVTIDELSMRMRKLKDDRSTTLYKDDTTVIEGVDIDLWWRVNETMTVSIGNKTFGGVDYMRVYQRGPWAATAYSQVCVLYQDGNIRLLPLTPHGLDWIPFGSSFIIGQTDPNSPRPSAAINHLDIDPVNLKVTVMYHDGSVVPIQIVPKVSETQLVVTNCHFVGDLQSQPFFTFRSMYVTFGNSDVDHISVDGGLSVPILDPWTTLDGNYFAFFRKCISKHNTQSPDITISIEQ